MMTGQNTSLGLFLTFEAYRRNVGDLSKGYRDAAYCIDAPGILAAGSHIRDEFGPEPENWMPRESMCGREGLIEP